ncbi:recombinase family protein [Actinosynnema sp. CA-248983]
MKYIGYARKSSESAERQILSINDQTHAIETKFAGLDVIDIVSESKSAFKPYNRPTFDEVLDRIERGEAQGLTAWHPNRLSRNEIDAGRIIYLIRSGKLRDLQFVTYTFENTPEGIWMLQMWLSQSQYESAKLGREVKRGIDTKLRQGHSPHKAPPGYVNSGATSVKGERYIYADKNRLPLVRRAFDLALSGSYTTAEIHREMLSWGFTTPRRAGKPQPVTYAQVHKMLRSVFYTGYFRHDGELHKGSYPAILTMQEHEQLQHILGRKRDDKSRRLTRRDYIHYSGLMKCSCGLTITPTEIRKYYRGTNRTARYLYYNCTRKSTRRDKCYQPRLSEPQLHQAFEEAVSPYRLIAPFRDLALAALNERYETRVEQDEKISDSQRREVVALKTKLDSLVDMRAAGEIDAETFGKQQSSYRERIAHLEQKLDRGDTIRHKAQSVTAQVFKDLARLDNDFRGAEPKTKRHILQAMARPDSNLVLRDGKLELQAKSWLAAIRESYPVLEVQYHATQTSFFGSPNQRLSVLVGIIAIWCSTVNTVANLVETELTSGRSILPLSPVDV